jgi:hypothetical protein
MLGGGLTRRCLQPISEGEVEAIMPGIWQHAESTDEQLTR